MNTKNPLARMIAWASLAIALCLGFGSGVTAQTSTAAAGAVAAASDNLAPALASGRPDFVVEILDDVSSPQELEAKHGIKAARVPDLKALTSAAAGSRKPVQLYYSVVRERAELALDARLAIAPLAAQPPPMLNPDQFVSLDALQDAIDRREAAQRAFDQKCGAYTRALADQTEEFVRKALTSVQALAISARDSAAGRGKHGFQASDIAGALQAAASRARTANPRVGAILVVNSDLIDIVNHRSSVATLPARDFPQAITIVICVNTSFEADRSPFLRAPGLELHHRANLAEAMQLVGELLNRS